MLTKPYRLIQRDNSFLPDTARRHFEATPSARKTLLWDGDTPHLGYCDQPELLDRAVASIDRRVSEMR
jgi:hypothetical protein